MLRAAGRVAALDLGGLYQTLAAQNVQVMTNGNGCQVELSTELFNGGGAAFLEDFQNALTGGLHGLIPFVQNSSAPARHLHSITMRQIVN